MEKTKLNSTNKAAAAIWMALDGYEKSQGVTFPNKFGELECELTVNGQVVSIEPFFDYITTEIESLIDSEGKHKLQEMISRSSVLQLLEKIHTKVYEELTH